jgi:hypothetical protein
MSEQVLSNNDLEAFETWVLHMLGAELPQGNYQYANYGPWVALM